MTDRGSAMERKLISIALTVSCLLAGCGSTTPTAPPASPAGSPAVQAEASAPVADPVRSPASYGNALPSASTAPLPTPAPDPDAGRKAAAAQYLAAGAARHQAIEALRSPVNDKQVARYERKAADIWDKWLAAAKLIQVPAGTSADLQSLIRIVNRYQAVQRGASAALAARPMDDWYSARRKLRDLEGKLVDAADRVRSDLGLPPLPTDGPEGVPHYDSFP
jgi:hypothetical protein